MVESLGLEIHAQVAVGANQEVAIEGRRHPLGVVIGRNQNLWRLHQVDAQDEQAPFAQYLPRRPQQGHRGLWRQIADGRSREKTDPSPLPGLVRRRRQMLEVADHRQNPQARIIGANTLGRLIQRRRADVDGDVGREVSCRVQHDPRLLAGPRAQLDQHRVRAEALGPFRRHPPQQGRLLPGGIVLRQTGDLLEQPRPLGVIKPLGRQGLHPARQAVDHVLTKGVVRARLLDQGSVRRQTDPREHPALMGIVEVAIAGPRMLLGRGERPATQDHLIGHELAVILRRRPLGRTEPRIGSIGAGRPLPDLARQVREGPG